MGRQQEAPQVGLTGQRVVAVRVQQEARVGGEEGALHVGFAVQRLGGELAESEGEFAANLLDAVRTTSFVGVATPLVIYVEEKVLDGDGLVRLRRYAAGFIGSAAVTRSGRQMAADVVAEFVEIDGVQRATFRHAASQGIAGQSLLRDINAIHNLRQGGNLKRGSGLLTNLTSLNSMRNLLINKYLIVLIMCSEIYLRLVLIKIK